VDCGSPSARVGTIIWGLALSSPLSSRPERTRISCYCALDRAACAPFREERRIKFANATKFYRKSGVAKRRDLRFPFACSWPSLRLYAGSTNTQEAP
jgi:hypothetical protein